MLVLKKEGEDLTNKRIKNLFIDANIWLSLFHYSSDDLGQFSKLKDLLGKQIQLFITEQVYNEVYRNRENKIKDALDKFEKFDLTFPVFFKNYEEYDEFRKKYDELKTSHKNWLKKVKNDIANRNTPADAVIKEFFDAVSPLSTTQEIVQNSVIRYDIGNPPGKDKKYGDAINWETLLLNVPDGEDLYFVSSDKDYASLFDDKQFHPFLEKEWESKKHSKIIFFKSLVEFLKMHVQDIELHAESYKDELIEELRFSRSFAYTHKIIADLSEYSDWSTRQIEDMCAAAMNNNQVSWLLGDDDVYDFYRKLLECGNAENSFDENVFAVKDELDRIDREVRIDE